LTVFSRGKNKVTTECLFNFEQFVFPTQKMILFVAIFEVNSSIGKLWDLLGHLVKKDSVDFNKYHFFYQIIL